MSLSQWTLFVQRCLIQRIDGDEFQELAQLMSEKHLIQSRSLTNVLLHCRRSFCPTEDPLIPLYIHATVALGLAQTSDVVLSLVKLWNQIEYRDHGGKQPGAIARADAAIVHDLATIVASDIPQKGTDSIQTSLLLSSRWLLALVKWIPEQSSQMVVQPVVTLIEAIGLFIANMASSDVGMTLLANKDSTGSVRDSSSILHLTGANRTPRISQASSECVPAFYGRYLATIT